MSTSQQLIQSLQAVVELQTNVRPPHSSLGPATITPARPSTGIGSLPYGALFLGMADDGLPVLLNLHDPLPGPLLVAGDAGAGKTRFLQGIVHSILGMYHKQDVQYAVVTGRPAEWATMEQTDHQVGIFPVRHQAVQEVFLSLVRWAHTKRSKQAVLLLIDDLEAVASMDPDALSNLRWLMLRGPARQVWTVVTQNAGRYGQVWDWIPLFRTRIFGRIEQAHIARVWGGDEASGLEKLEAGGQFSLRENGSWLRFRMP